MQEHKIVKEEKMEREKACNKTDDQCLSNFMIIRPNKLFFY